MKEQIKFHGIDSFGRPVFRSLKYPRNFFGSVTKLVRTKEDVDSIAECDLCFFGNSFNCEPMGTESASTLEIIK